MRDLRRNVARTLALSWSASPGSFILNAAFAVAVALIPPATALLLRNLVNLVAAGASHKLQAADLVPTILGLALLTTGSRVLGTVQTVAEYLFSQRVQLKAERRFSEKATRVDLGHFDNSDWHDRMNRARDGLSFRPSQLTQAVVGLGGAFITLFAMMGILLTLHLFLVALALVSVVPVLAVNRRITRKLYSFFWTRTADRRERQYVSQLTSDHLVAKEVRAFTLGDYLVDRYHSLAMELHRKETSLYHQVNLTRLFSGFLSGVVLGLAYAFVGGRVLQGLLRPGDITLLVSAISSVTGYMNSISSTFVRIEENAAFLDDYFSFLAIEPLVAVSPVPLAMPAGPAGLDAGIEFEGVHFLYPGKADPALVDVNLHIRSGEMMALVGDNGAGKTTLIKLLLRFYDPTRGSIRVGGVDIREVDPTELRQRIGILFQDYGQYQLSVRDNVGFGRVERNADDDSVTSAIHKARAEWLLKGLNDGLDSKVGRLFEGGHDLSGGEWQRLALARLMFRDADIWILDEPTSNLDPEAEATIFSELRQTLHGRIGIIISHRFSTVRIADRIAVVRDGRISELGTHEELVALRGRYAELFELQAASYR